MALRVSLLESFCLHQFPDHCGEHCVYMPVVGVIDLPNDLQNNLLLTKLSLCFCQLYL